MWLRKCEALTVRYAGFGMTRAISYRYRHKAPVVLAARASELTEALHQVHIAGWAYVILDGKLIDADRCAATTTSRTGEQIDVWYSGKRRGFAGDIQSVMRPCGLMFWASGAEPSPVRDLTAARERALGVLYTAAARGLPTMADPGYRGDGIGIHVPFA